MNKWIFGVLALLLFSCRQQESESVESVESVNKSASTLSYFDINGYFSKEAERLQKINPTIEKEVLAKGKTEQKNLKITNWKTELASFSGADINKTSWRGEFTIEQNGAKTTYTTSNPKIPIKFVEISKAGEKIIGVRIFKSSSNSLYTATDTLIYYPDSLYLVKSQQKIKLLNEREYRIIGKFK